ncbi:MAG: hypothetical protein ABH871_06045 [Pseudomonadota bacterium]
MKMFYCVLATLLIVMTSACSNNSSTNTGGTTGGGDTGGGTDGANAIMADHSVIEALNLIPTEYLNAVYANLKIYYGHTSHGSQLMTGLDLLDDAKFDRDALSIEEEYGDLGTDGDLSWAQTTRARLNQPGSAINVVIWSWCGGVSDNNTAGIDAYLNEMNELEGEYPNVSFVYMTGHTDGTGANGTLRTMNARIRDWCRTHDKILYDFEDIESWNPNGTYYPDASDACEWCSTWCASNTCGPYSISCTNDSDCAHSHCFNCYNKGKAFWWLLARIAGWNGS